MCTSSWSAKGFRNKVWHIDHQCYQTRGLGARLGYFWLWHSSQQSLTTTLLLLGYFWLLGREMSWNRAPLWKIVNFLSIQGDFNFLSIQGYVQRQWADLSSIDRIKKSYGAIEGDYLQLPELDNLSFFCPNGWFWLICHIKTPKIRHLGAFLLDEKLGYF